MSSPANLPDRNAAERPRVGVVIPFANEAGTFRGFMDRVLAQLREDDRVFCVFDNVCKDGTVAIAREAAGEDGRIVVVWSPENRCVVDAYVRGYREALDAGFSWILEMDGGLSHAPEEMPLFFAAMSTGVDFAAGSRFTEGGSYLGRWTRYMVSRGGTVLANLLTGTRMKDMTSGFECFTRDALRHVLNKGIRSRGHFFQTEIRFHLRNWSWVEVPITYRNPSKSVGAGSLKEGLRELRRLRRIARREDPGKCLKVRSTQS